MRLNLRTMMNWPSSMFARMAIIMLFGLLSAQMISVWLQSGERANVVTEALVQNFADQLSEAIRALESADASSRPAVLASLQSNGLHIRLIPADQVASYAPRGHLYSLLSARLGSERELRAASMGMGLQGSSLRSFDVRLRDGQWIKVEAQLDARPPALPRTLIAQLLVSLLIVIAVVMLAVRQASQPLKQLVEAADQLGKDLNAPALVERGSSETRSAAQAFNRMQGRIRHLIDERARALAAVSHDLRTPLTRLRLRAELVDDDKLRDQMAADLDAMASMIDATLDYLRGLQDSESPRRIDMNALLQSMVADSDLLGKTIAITGRAQSPYTGRLSALRRALQNLIDNAIKYGHSAHIRIEDSNSELRISIEDDGPGIAVDELGRVTDPYYRPDASRNTETGGVGLGLSIVKDIALMHGGDLLLANRPSGGLSATLTLPRNEARR